jgi:molybdopterin-guanine dinucleotide biosynthesis protein A
LIDSTLPSDRFLAYRSESDGLPEPLAAYYAAAALPIWEAALAEDLRCPRKILIRENCRLIAAVTPRALENANTPQDWASAILP